MFRRPVMYLNNLEPITNAYQSWMEKCNFIPASVFTTSMKTFFFGIVFFVYAFTGAHAQINLYSRMTDPRALARLDGPDSEPLRYVNRFGYPTERDSSDNNFILAQDSGAGVITHFWSTGTAADSTTSF